MPACACPPGASPFIRDAFRDCVGSSRDAAGFALGLASIACWLVAQVPQVVRNARAGTAEALSPLFLAAWLAGDSSNLAGCLLTGSQAPTQTYTAVYYLCMDAVMVTQAAFFALRSRRVALLGPDHAAARLLPALLAAGALPADAAGQPPLCSEPAARAPWARGLGAALGWVSAGCYLGSRVAQLVRNRRRPQVVEGLAPLMFGLAICGNALYGGSVLLRCASWADLGERAPWLAGSLGVMGLDCLLGAQALAASRARRAAAAEEEAGEYAPPPPS